MAYQQYQDLFYTCSNCVEHILHDLNLRERRPLATASEWRIVQAQ
jgi:hypothetical protein